ncbi:hypothetical protein BGZ65_010464 [Modicella reniformis]|uniref:F-box domain-containing protein n=1 Tax=Modicella reniformis TaxID=1440133 RepID=A0A9P6MAK5_9FUNG|nr:hypothetical protein BGZ65_010464 [Modicella reniformis]
MDLPEITAAVASFLSLSDLAAAARVCRSWNASFIPTLFSVIHLQSFTQPASEGVTSHADHIKRLHIMTDEFEIFVEKCTKLEYLFIELYCRDPDIWHQYSTLVQHNPKLKTIEIRDNGETLPTVFLEAVSTCPGLRNLQVHMHDLDETCMAFILDSAVHLEYLLISGLGNTPPKSLDKWPCFPTMKKLEMEFDTKFPIQLQLEMFRKCPKLRAMTWRVSAAGGISIPVSDLFGIIDGYGSVPDFGQLC